MDDGSPPLSSDAPSADLASIVLASSKHDRQAVAPEIVPIDAGQGSAGSSGFDSRSVIVLALVVAVLAAIIGWVATGGSDPQPPAVAKTKSSSHESAATQASAQPTSSQAQPSTLTASGIDLAIGRVVPAGSGEASVSIGIANPGTVDFQARDDASVLVLVDGAIAATKPLPAVAAGASTRVDIPLHWCPGGTVPVTVVLDPSAVVREVDERNDATSRSMSFDC